MTIKTELLKRYIYDYITNYISDFEIDENKIAETTSIKILKEIQNIIQNHEYTDFDKVECIVCLFEKYHISAGCCHDF